MNKNPNPTINTGREAPWVELRSAAFQTFIYQKMVRAASPDAKPGACVNVYDRQGSLFGHALYNPRSLIVLRMMNFDATPVDEAFWRDAIERAVSLRKRVLRLDETTNAYRLIHAEGDELSGLVVDRYDSVLSIEIFSLGMWRAKDIWLPILLEVTGLSQYRIHVDERVQSQEGFKATPMRSDDLPAFVNITENGVRFRVQFDVGHKTGFFCDQRDNRRKLASLAKDADVLDVCSYTGGFGIAAKTTGGAGEVTCVDLDEDAIELARKNANLNQARLSTVHADGFAYMRQMQTNGRKYDIVVLDPPKLVFGRSENQEGRTKYFDLNRLGASLVKSGGLLLSCSCSGAMWRDEFVELVFGAARHAGRQSQLLEVTGAASDHPISPRCPESSYLKSIWLRII